ncbi:Glycosyl transferases group 1 [Azospirillum oryzae]|uniref:Glycosyl transferases group 1 n=1 Tax=Azospirillum oryzae TaxID=286727 RepID=A0A1X7EXP9_9PROT|nr:glycosyltransferase [Azospirillum oryzae]SMF42222.1 Glycosyl transferases group 1 [Azospirillum oryzae]
MRILQIATYYETYLREFHRVRPHLQERSYAEQLGCLLDDSFGAGHLIAPHLAARGHEAELIVANWVSGQARWARENGLFPPSGAAEAIALCVEQVNRFDPDVLYLLDPITLDAGFVAALKRRPRLVLGWRQANIPDGTDWTGFDLMLSADPVCRKRACELGARSTALYRPGFPDWILPRLSPRNPEVDVVFVGNVTPEHSARLALLEAVARGAEQGRYTAAFHLGNHSGSDLPPAIARISRPPAWGTALYQATRSGRIGLNIHIDITGAAMNMRILETAGCGTLLLTEADPELASLLAPGLEVAAYDRGEDLPERIEALLADRVGLEAMASRGQARVLKDHSMAARAEWFERIVLEHS